MTDLAIIGSGPAAMGAAIYAARANLAVVMYERDMIGGTLPEIAHIGNYPGFDGAGAELAKSLRAQVESLGVKIEYEEIKDLSALDSRAVLVATGSEPRPLAFEPEPPVSYCALCDAPLYKGKNILVIGGGNSAIGESLMLADFAKHLTIMTHSDLKAEASRIEELERKENVEILKDVEPTPENTKGYDGIFVYIGKRPAADFMDEKFRDADGFIMTESENSHRVTKNIFAAGDVRAGSIKQAIAAAADGVAAALEIIESLKEG